MIKLKEFFNKEKWDNIINNIKSDYPNQNWTNESKLFFTFDKLYKVFNITYKNAFIKFNTTDDFLEQLELRLEQSLPNLYLQSLNLKNNIYEELSKKGALTPKQVSEYENNGINHNQNTNAPTNLTFIEDLENAYAELALNNATYNHNKSTGRTSAYSEDTLQDALRLGMLKMPYIVDNWLSEFNSLFSFISGVSTSCGVITSTNTNSQILQELMDFKNKWVNGEFYLQLKGDKGEKGERGLDGANGLQGLQGPQGERGADGARGEKGDTLIYLHENQVLTFDNEDSLDRFTQLFNLTPNYDFEKQGNTIRILHTLLRLNPISENIDVLQPFNAFKQELLNIHNTDKQAQEIINNNVDNRLSAVENQNVNLAPIENRLSDIENKNIEQDTRIEKLLNSYKGHINTNNTRIRDIHNVNNTQNSRLDNLEQNKQDKLSDSNGEKLIKVENGVITYHEVPSVDLQPLTDRIDNNEATINALNGKILSEEQRHNLDIQTLSNRINNINIDNQLQPIRDRLVEVENKAHEIVDLTPINNKLQQLENRPVIDANLTNRVNDIENRLNGANTTTNNQVEVCKYVDKPLPDNQTITFISGQVWESGSGSNRKRIFTIEENISHLKAYLKRAKVENVNKFNELRDLIWTNTSRSLSNNHKVIVIKDLGHVGNDNEDGRVKGENVLTIDSTNRINDKATFDNAFENVINQLQIEDSKNWLKSYSCDTQGSINNINISNGVNLPETNGEFKLIKVDNQGNIEYKNIDNGNGNSNSNNATVWSIQELVINGGEIFNGNDTVSKSFNVSKVKRAWVEIALPENENQGTPTITETYPLYLNDEALIKYTRGISRADQFEKYIKKAKINNGYIKFGFAVLEKYKDLKREKRLDLKLYGQDWRIWDKVNNRWDWGNYDKITQTTKITLYVEGALD